MTDRDTNLLINVIRNKVSRKNILFGKTSFLFVEGYLDEIVFSRIIDPNVEIISVGNLGFRVHNNRDAIYSVVSAFNNGINNINASVYGIIDRDFEGCHSEASNIFITDMNDLETTLINCGAFSFESSSCCNDEKIRNIECYSYQVGCFRKCIIEYSRDVGVRIAQIIDESFFKKNLNRLYVLNRNLDLFTFVQYLQSSGRFALGSSLQVNEMIDYVKRKMIDKNYYDNTGVFYNKLPLFCKDSIEDFWSIIKGHDYFNFAKSMILDLVGMSWDKYDIHIGSHIDINKFKETNIFKKLINSGLIMKRFC